MDEHSLNMIKKVFSFEMSLLSRLHGPIRSRPDTTPLDLLSDQARIVRRKSIRGDQLFTRKETSDHRHMPHISRYSPMYHLVGLCRRNNRFPQFKDLPCRKCELGRDWKLVLPYPARYVYSAPAWSDLGTLARLANATPSGGCVLFHQ
jgi:hypothetical protein